VNFHWSQAKYGLIFGAGHGIGCALAKELLQRFPQLILTATYRLPAKAMELFQLKERYQERLQLVELDPTQEEQLALVSQKIPSDVSLDFVFNCIGFLHREDIRPEKSLREFSVDNFLEVMRVNACVTALIAKYLEKKLPRSTPALFVSLSAKVGSIEDNELGGWHSYRASKAALNMLIKNIAIEFSRKRLPCLVSSVHPGTTNTALSASFVAHTNHKVYEPQETASRLIELFEARDVTDTGIFLSYNGEKLPW
jgi:NAD(P)-dependent dehydrogenase (short-subunit alcohol dehydrogenase family)